MLLTQGGALLVEDALEDDAGVAPQLGATAGRLDQLPQLRSAQQTNSQLRQCQSEDTRSCRLLSRDDMGV